MSPAQKTLHVHISNNSEDVWDFIQELSEKQRVFEIAENAELSDRDLFGFTDQDDVIVIIPKAIDSNFLSYFLSMFPKENLSVLWPAKHEGALSEDIQNDNDLLKKLYKEFEAYSNVEITSYSTTAQFIRLLETFKQKYSHVQALEAPNDNWMVEHFGSKAGLRQYQYTSDGSIRFPMCKGTVTFGCHTAASLATGYNKDGQGVVIKTHKGHAGMGVLIIARGELKHSETSYIEEKMKESYWFRFPIVVEEWIECDSSVGGGFPNAEVFVEQNGTVNYLYSCGMRVLPSGEFKGVEIGKGALPDDVNKLLHQYGLTLGNLYAEQGYAGYFDVDCLYGKNKVLYVSESNVRRTGGTHVYLTAKSLFGPKFESETYALSNNTYKILNEKPISFQELHVKLKPILFDKSSKEGLFIIAASLLHRAVFGYIIFADTKNKAYAIEAQMEELLK